MRMSQSLADLEEAFLEQTVEERDRVERVQREAVVRSRQRRVDRAHKHGTMRFVALWLAIVATAVLVTVAMFETLYVLLG